MGDDAGDDRGDGAWLTYEQLAEVRHITRRAAVRMTQRHRLRRQPGNDGLVLVWVPHDMASPSQRQSHHDDGDDDAGDGGGDVARDNGLLLAGALAALEDAVAALREQLDVASARAERAEADRADERQRADDLRAQIDALNAEMVVVRAEADRLSAQERARSDALGAQVDELHAGQEMMMDTHARALADAQDQLERVREAAEHLRQADADRKARGLVARLRAAWRGE